MKNSPKNHSSIDTLNKNKHQVLLVVITLAVLLVFLFLRTFLLTESFHFFNDMGRDMYVLQQWNETGKPPLLGPQTSALPFNQSALYFYILYPFFLISNHSLYSSIIAVLILHVAGILTGLYFLKGSPQKMMLWLVAWVLLSIHPQMVVQHRFVWNPSFVALLLMLAYATFVKLTATFSKITLFIFTVFLAMATAFSYSAVPAVLMALLISFVLLKTKRMLLIFFFGSSLFLLNAPTVAFELRHKFVLTNLLLHGEKLHQGGNNLSEKINNISQFVFALPNVNHVIVFLTLLAVTIGLIMYRQKSEAKELGLITLFFVGTMIITIIAPTSLHAHYVFGMIVGLILVIAHLPPRYGALFCIALFWYWLQPGNLQGYTRPAIHTTAELHQCAELVCQEQKDTPLFVSVQAGYHPFHNGFEYKYILNEHGCDVEDIETNQNAAEYMAVFADKSTYNHGQTAYNELTQFGSAIEEKTIQCPSEIKVHLLKKVR